MITEMTTVEYSVSCSITETCFPGDIISIPERGHQLIFKQLVVCLT